MKAYSEDLRLRVVAAVDGGMPRAAVARVFEVGSATITRYLRLRRETGGLGPRPRHGPPPIKTLTLDGFGPGLLLDGALNRAAFEAYVDQILAPTLRPGQIVVADNLRAHDSDAARAAIEARGAELWFLPGYSPDLNPIEEGFAKLKAQLRRDEPRTDAAVSAAIWQARRTVTPGDARGFFTHCGYLSSDHLS